VKLLSPFTRQLSDLLCPFPSSLNLALLKPWRNHVFDNIIALVIPIVMIAITFAWVPLLNFICPPHQCSSGWQCLRDAASKTQPPLLFRERINQADLGLHRR
jgi:hypothetical protein